MPDPNDNLWNRIIDRQKYLERVRLPVEVDPVASWSDIFDLLQPGVTPWETTGEEGQDIGLNAQTGYPAFALRVCANGMLGHLVSRAYEWFAYVPQNRALRDIQRFKQYYQKCREQVSFTLSDSNFYEVLSTHARLAISIGNSIVLRENDDERDSQSFTVPHPRECFWARGKNAKIKCFHRKFPKTAYKAQDEFDKKLLSDSLNESLTDKKNIFKKYDFIEAIYHHDDPILKGESLPNRPWICVYIQRQTDENKQRPLSIEGFWTFPGGPWTFELNSDEEYGRGLGTYAIYDIKQLNQMVYTNTLSCQQEADPSMIAPRFMRGKFKTKPAGRNWLDTNQLNLVNRDTFRRVFERTAIPYALERENMMRDLVDNWFGVKYFMMLTNLEKALSPYELAEMLGEKAIILANGIGQFESGCMDPLMEAVFIAEDKAKRMPDVPEELLEYGESPMPKVEYLGPLDKALRRLFKVRQLQQFVATAAPIISLAPESRYVLKADQLLRKLLEDEDVDVDCIRSQDEYDQIVQQMAQRQQQMENLQMLTQLVKTVPALQKETSETSPMAALTGQTMT